MTKRKTKAQKKIAELRHKLSYQKGTSITTIATKTTSQMQQEPQKKLFYKLPEHIKHIHDTSPSYTYLRKDLIRTALLSGSIVVLQLLLFIFLKTHALPYLGL